MKSLLSNGISRITLIITLVFSTQAAGAPNQGTVKHIAAPPSPSPGIRDLPVRETPPNSQGATDLLAVIFTGDGGWGETDGGIARSLAAKGIGVANVNSLRYFRTERTPESSARDLERIIEHYSETWNARHIILIGYSFGADVVPFMINRLSRENRDRIAEVILISPGHRADFTFHFGSWFGHTTKKSLPVLPEAAKMRGMNIFCFYGKGDKNSLGPEFPNGLAKVVPLKTGHRIKKKYQPVVNAILTGVER